MRLFFLIIFLNLIFSNYSIIQSESEIKYFGSHPIYSFAGSSSSIILFSDCNNPDNSCDFKFKIPIISLNSGNGSRDNDMLNCLDFFSYPEIILDVENFIVRDYKEEFILADLSIHGISQGIQVPLTLVKISPGNYKVNSEFSILLNEFNVDIPKLLFLPINNEIKIEVQLSIKEAD